jgi:hypothetical protein
MWVKKSIMADIPGRVWFKAAVLILSLRASALQREKQSPRDEKGTASQKPLAVTGWRGFFPKEERWRCGDTRNGAILRIAGFKVSILEFRMESK